MVNKGRSAKVGQGEPTMEQLVSLVGLAIGRVGPDLAVDGEEVGEQLVNKSLEWVPCAFLEGDADFAKGGREVSSIGIDKRLSVPHMSPNLSINLAASHVDTPVMVPTVGVSSSVGSIRCLIAKASVGVEVEVVGIAEQHEVGGGRASSRRQKANSSSRDFGCCAE